MRGVTAALALSLCAAMPAFAQDAPGSPRVGVLSIITQPASGRLETVLREAFAALGQVDGRNLHLDFRFAEGDPGRLPELAETLAREKARVIVAFNGARDAQRATSTIPIVAISHDLVGSGLIGSLARPGGNITGVSLFGPELEAKKLEILKEILPEARRFAFLNDAAVRSPEQQRMIADAGRVLGIELQTIDVSRPADFAAAFSSFQTGGAEGLIIVSTGMMIGFGEQLGPLILKNKLPAICARGDTAQTGCLASYDPSFPELFAMVAAITDKLLKGASPGETPAQQPTRFELVINQKVARAIGVEIPSGVLGRADEVIE